MNRILGVLLLALLPQIIQGGASNNSTEEGVKCYVERNGIKFLLKIGDCKPTKPFMPTNLTTVEKEFKQYLNETAANRTVKAGEDVTRFWKRDKTAEEEEEYAAAAAASVKEMKHVDAEEGVETPEEIRDYEELSSDVAAGNPEQEEAEYKELKEDNLSILVEQEETEFPSKMPIRDSQAPVSGTSVPMEPAFPTELDTPEFGNHGEMETPEFGNTGEEESWREGTDEEDEEYHDRLWALGVAGVASAVLALAGAICMKKQRRKLYFLVFGNPKYQPISLSGEVSQVHIGKMTSFDSQKTLDLENC